MPGRNSNLSKAKKAKNDEFYTQLADIEKELSHYPVEAFKDKVIYCPMDVAVNTGATMQSQFVKYFQMNAHRLQFKKLICTCLVERAAAEGESLEQVQNCYVLERVTVPADQRHIYGYTHGYGRNNGVVGETVDEVGRIMYDTQDGHSHKVPYHIINQAVTEANGRIVLVKKYIDHYDEVDGHPVLGDEYTGRGWVFEGHQLTTKWCRKHPDGTIEMLPDECYFFNNGDFLSDFSIFPKDEAGNPCFESVDGGSVCLYPSEYYDYREVEYEEYSSHCPADSTWGSGDFRSEYCKKLLAECDIVVTNPPFSLFREWWDLIIHSEKCFIFIGNINCVTYKEVFPYIKSGELKVGFNVAGGSRKGNSMYYWSPVDGKLRDIQSWWFHNIPGIKETGKHPKSEYLPMVEWTRKGVEYPKYDNYDAIDVSAEQKIPIDYEGVMGVPITALRYLDLSLFEIVAFRKNADGDDLVFTSEREHEFNRIFGFLFDGVDGSNYRSSLDDVFRRKEQICQDSDSTEDMKFFAEYICSHLDLAEQAVLKRESSRGTVRVEHGLARGSEECRGQDGGQDYLRETADSQELSVCVLQILFPSSLQVDGLMNNPKDTAVGGKNKYARILVARC